MVKSIRLARSLVKCKGMGNDMNCSDTELNLSNEEGNNKAGSNATKLHCIFENGFRSQIKRKLVQFKFLQIKSLSLWLNCMTWD